MRSMQTMRVCSAVCSLGVSKHTGYAEVSKASCTLSCRRSSDILCGHGDMKKVSWLPYSGCVNDGDIDGCLTICYMAIL